MFTAEEMLAEADGKMNSHNPIGMRALKSVPIPALSKNLRNYNQWDHAVGFHLEYHGLKELVEGLKVRYVNGPQREDFSTVEQWHRWQRHCLHAYSIIYSRATKVVEEAGLMHRGWNAGSNYCPYELLKMIREYRDRTLYGANRAMVPAR